MIGSSPEPLLSHFVKHSICYPRHQLLIYALMRHTVVAGKAWPCITRWRVVSKQYTVPALFLLDQAILSFINVRYSGRPFRLSEKSVNEHGAAGRGLRLQFRSSRKSSIVGISGKAVERKMMAATKSPWSRCVSGDTSRGGAEFQRICS